MFVQLSDTLPCETLKTPAASCNRPARVGILKIVETLADVTYVVLPICGQCIAALAQAAGQAPSADSEAISTQTIKQVLAQRLGLEGADEVLCALRAAGTEEDDHADD
jgi:hypothetical protein